MKPSRGKLRNYWLHSLPGRVSSAAPFLSQLQNACWQDNPGTQGLDQYKLQEAFHLILCYCFLMKCRHLATRNQHSLRSHTGEEHTSLRTESQSFGPASSATTVFRCPLETLNDVAFPVHSPPIKRDNSALGMLRETWFQIREDH